MSIPIVEPVTQAIHKTREILFDTFEMSKWLELGFCAFLMNLGSGGGSNFNFNFGVPVVTALLIIQAYNLLVQR